MNTRTPRWATRREALAYSRIGATKFSELVKKRRVFARKLDGRKSLVDLNSVDDLFVNSCPEAADA
jgi:hypothetical protein